VAPAVTELSLQPYLDGLSSQAFLISWFDIEMLGISNNSNLISSSEYKYHCSVVLFEKMTGIKLVYVF